MNWDSPAKNTARSIAVAPIERPARTALSLPAPQMLDVIESLEVGTANRKTFYIMAEEEPVAAKCIARNSKRFGFVSRPYLHKGPLETLYLPGILGVRVIDFAFLDYCGPLNELRLQWLRSQFMPFLSQRSVFAITVKLTTRNSRFMPRFVDAVICDSAVSYMTDLNAALSDTGRRFGPAMVPVYAAIELAFCDCQLELEDCLSYTARGSSGGGAVMGLFRFRVLRKGARNHLPSRLERRLTGLLESRPHYRATVRRYS